MKSYNVFEVKKFLKEKGLHWTGKINTGYEDEPVEATLKDLQNKSKLPSLDILFRYWNDTIYHGTLYLYLTDKEFYLYEKITEETNKESHYELYRNFSNDWNNFLDENAKNFEHDDEQDLGE